MDLSNLHGDEPLPDDDEFGNSCRSCGKPVSVDPVAIPRVGALCQDCLRQAKMSRHQDTLGSDQPLWEN